jgi:hypothetical protein
VRCDGVQALVLQHEAVRHVQVADGNLFAMQGGQFNGGLPGQADAGHFGAPYIKKTEHMFRATHPNWSLFLTFAQAQPRGCLCCPLQGKKQERVPYDHLIIWLFWLFGFQGIHWL